MLEILSSRTCFVKIGFVKIGSCMDASASLTQLRREVREGDKGAIDNLLQPTALVHETYLRMIGQQQPDYRDRSHFFGIAAQLMRQILIDHARARNAGRRGGGRPKLSIPDFSMAEMADASASDPALFPDPDQAMQRLEARDPRKARVIDLRFFAGLTVEECADIPGVSVETIWRDLRMGQAWLRHELSRDPL